jgi:hypothetical protein
MKRLILITGKYRAGLEQMSKNMAWYYDRQEKNILTIYWMFKNEDIFEGCPFLFRGLEPNTKVVIVHDLPRAFDYERLRYIAEQEVITFKEGDQHLEAASPYFLFTSLHHPKTYIDKEIFNHIKI